MNIGGSETKLIKSTVFEENIGALTTANTVKMNPCTKQIVEKYHLFKHRCGKGSGITLVKVGNLMQKADIFTKLMAPEKFIMIRKLVCKW